MKNISIATLAGHSALEICLGAKHENLKTLLIVQKGRDKTYTRYFKNLVDDYLLVDSFKQLTSSNVINYLSERNAVFIPHRYLQVYCDMEKLEKDFPIPIFGNKHLLKYEEREGKYTQYELLKESGIDFPKQYSKPSQIDRLVIVKVKEKQRNYERAFFFATNEKEYTENSQKLMKEGKINLEALEQAIIEEYLVGTQVNFNFFYSVLKKRLELLGTDARRQTNIDGLMRIPADQQLQTTNYIHPSYIETGHFAVTVKESLLEKAFEMGEKLVTALKKYVPPGMIGPFALQTAIIPGPPKERIVVYDVSLRMPGSPGTVFTPYSQYLFGESVSFGTRIAMEIKEAVKLKKLNNITS
jgi:5-formaminoimidazole-4-carboxamide-1-(beta)-D-ribofuranosyl 5'-monophosphate synthetase